jgi:hypothetical protein
MKTYDRFRYETRQTRAELRGREDFRRVSVERFENIGETLITGFQAAKIVRLLSA